MANKKYFWFKLKDDFFRRKEIKKLRRLAGGDTYTIIYLKLLLLSLINEGKLCFDGIEANIAEELALEIDEEPDNVRFTLMYLQDRKLLENITEDELFLVEAAENIGSETQGAERVRRFRESQKALQCNANVTKCNTEIEKEIDIDIYSSSSKDTDLQKIAKVWGQEFQQFMTPNQYTELSYYLDQGIQPETIAYAIKEAAFQNKRTLAYVIGILKSYLAAGILTVGQAQQAKEDYKSRNKPQHKAPPRQETEKERKRREAQEYFEELEAQRSGPKGDANNT